MLKNNNYLRELFVKLAQINSPSGQEQQIVGFVQKELRQLGLGAKRDKFGNLLYQVPGQGEPLMLAAHLDTVMPTAGIKIVFKNGVFCTDGKTILGADDKAGVAVLMALLRQLRQQKTAHLPLEVLFVLSEEVGLEGARFGGFYNILKSKRGINLDAHDPVGQITTKAPCYIKADLEVIGKAAHAGAFPEKGINAVKVFADALAKIKVGKVAADLTCNFGIVEAKGARNVVPEKLSALGEVRSFSRSKAESYVAKIQQIFAATAKKYGAKVNWQLQLETEAYAIKTSAKLIQRFKRAALELGLPFAANSTLGASDANIYNTKGIATFDMGLNYQDIHSTKESIALADMQKAVILLNKVVSADKF